MIAGHPIRGAANRSKRKSLGSRSVSSESSSLSTNSIQRIIESLKNKKHRDSTKKNYYTVWKVFNKFILRLDVKPRNWKDRLTLFVGYLVHSKKQSSMVRSYISAIRTVLSDEGISLNEDKYLISSLTKACRLVNDQMTTRLLIQKTLLGVIIHQIHSHYLEKGQEYLSAMYCALFSTAYYGLFRVGELTTGTHPVLACNVQIAKNKRKMLFILRT